MKLSIIIPVYNEERTLHAIIKKINSVKLDKSVIKEVIAVNDGSTDNSAKILEEYKNDASFKVFHLSGNSGKTAALLEGFKHSTGEIIMIQDADLEYDPCQIPKLIQPILDKKTSIVYGSRFKGNIQEMKLINRTANIISNIFFNLLYPAKITDINTCYKAFNADILKSIQITSKEFTFETEVTAKIINRGHSIQEVPIDYVARTISYGKKINWKKALMMFWGIVKYRRST